MDIESILKTLESRIDDLSEEQENQEHRLAFLEKKASPYPAFKGANLHFVDKLPIPKCCETCKHGQEDFYSCPEVGESCDYDTGLKKWEPAPAIEQLEKFLKWKGYHIGSTSPDNVVGSDIGALTHLGPGVTRGADGKQSILATALEIQKSDDPERPHKDGGTVDAFYSIADLWNAYLGMEPEKTEWWLGPGDVASMMILLKLAREEVGHNRDNLVDIAGYAHCLQALTEEAE